MRGSGWWAVALGLLVPLRVGAEPRGRILSVVAPLGPNDEQVLTTLLDVGDARTVAEVTKQCDGLRDQARLDCVSRSLQHAWALFSPYPFPISGYVELKTTLAGVTSRLQYVSEARLYEADDPRAGTAWLVLLDVDARSQARAEALQVLEGLLETLGPHDQIALRLRGENGVLVDSLWQDAKDLSAVRNLMQFPPSPPERAGNSLASTVAVAASDGFGSLEWRHVPGPLHRALIVLSDRKGDASMTSDLAREVSRHLAAGDLVVGGPPVPASVVSVYFPRPGALDEQALELMQNLPDASMGGHFTVLQPGELERARALATVLRQRFGRLHVVKWPSACSVQSGPRDFELAFGETKPALAGDTLRGVPIAACTLPAVMDGKPLPELPAEPEPRAATNLPMRCDVLPYCERGWVPPIEGTQLSLLSGIATGLGARKSADGDRVELPLALRASYVSAARFTPSARVVQYFGLADGLEATTTRAEIEAGWSFQARRLLLEPYLGLGGAWVRHFENRAQFVGAVGVASSLPLGYGLRLGAGGDVMWLLPESEVAVTGFLGLTLSP